MAKSITTARRKPTRRGTEGQTGSFWRSRSEASRRAIVMAFASDLRQVRTETRDRMLGQLRALHPDLGRRVEQAIAS